MAETSKERFVKSWKDKVMGFPFRLMERCSRSYWVVCQIPKTSTVMGFTTIDGLSSIGEYTFINRFCEITRTSIGNYCSIGSGVRVGSGEHDLELLSTSSFVTGHVAADLTTQPCKIGHDVWIGTQAFVKRGVVIGNGVVIGAHAVVTKDVPDFAIVVGNPARVVKYRFPLAIKEKVSDSQWWSLSLTEAKEVLKEMNENNDA